MVVVAKLVAARGCGPRECKLIAGSSPVDHPMNAASLKVGDRIRIVRKPLDWAFCHRETKVLYNKLIKRARSLRIARIETDPAGVKGPWIECKIKERNGWHWHSLLILDDGSWVKVKKRAL